MKGSMKLLLPLTLLFGCASMLPPRHCMHVYQGITLTAPGWAQSTTKTRATVVVVVHNPFASMAEVTVNCGPKGKALITKTVRLAGHQEQELHFGADRIGLAGSVFSCEITNVEYFGP